MMCLSWGSRSTLLVIESLKITHNLSTTFPIVQE